MSTAANNLIPESCAFCQARASCLFFDLPPAVSSQFQAITQARSYSRGVTLYRQGDEVQDVYILRSGWAKLFWVSLTGKRRFISVAGSGSILGLTELFSESRHEVCAELIEDSTLEYIEKNQFLSFLNQNPELAVKLLAVVSREARRSLAGLCEMSGKLDPADRLLHTLQEYAESCGQETIEGVKLRIPFTVEDIADSIGCSRQWTTKLLKVLEEQGFILRKKGWIILTPQTLEKRSHTFKTSP